MLKKITEKKVGARNRNFGLFNICLMLFAGCVSRNSSSVKVWRASVDNGDKVGIGIELDCATNGIAGFMYLLEPSKPHDFAAGLRLPMQLHQVTRTEIHFGVTRLHEEMVLRLTKPLDGNLVHAVLQSADGQDEPQDYEFIRIK